MVINFELHYFRCLTDAALASAWVYVREACIECLVLDRR